MKPALLVLTLCFVALAARQVGAQTNVDGNLYRVHKIFLETQNTAVTREDLSERGMIESRSLDPFMREALTKYGFVVVNNAADADAVLYGANTGALVVLDGPQPDPPGYTYEFWLYSAKYSFKWKTKVDLSTHASETERGRKATQKAVHNLFSAWKKSASRAGVVVADRVR
jgi:hypothetical protein